MTYKVNMKQTSKERQIKYQFMRNCGVSVKRAQLMRDWTYNHIIKHLSAIYCRRNYKKLGVINEDKHR